MAPSSKLATFYRMIDTAPLPRRADRSALGSLPTRAYRHCDAVTSAAGFGWYVFPPIDFSLFFDGHQVVWTCVGLDGWFPLGAAQFPGFATSFDERAPAALRGFSPQFLTAIQEPGVVQIWTGLLARTAPNWSLLVRPTANLPRHAGYDVYEGIVETDDWFGPLFTNLRLTRTDYPVEFRTDEPLVQVQPIPQASYSDAVLNNVDVVSSLEGFGSADWADYRRTIVEPNQDPERRPGSYAAEARRRRRCPVSGHGAPALPGMHPENSLAA